MKIRNNKLLISINPYNISLYKVRNIDTSHHMSKGIEGTRDIFIGHYSNWADILEMRDVKVLEPEALTFLSEIRDLFLMQDLFNVGTHSRELEISGILEFDNHKHKTDRFMFRFFRSQVLVYYMKPVYLNEDDNLDELEPEDDAVSSNKPTPMIGAFSYLHRLSQSTAMYALAKKYHGQEVELDVVKKDVADIKSELKFLSLKK